MKTVHTTQQNRTLNAIKRTSKIIIDELKYLYHAILCLVFLISVSQTFGQGMIVNQGSSNTSSQTGGYLHVGDENGQYLSIDNNEIQARFDFGDNSLSLNPFGGSVRLLGSPNNTGDLHVDGNGIYYQNLNNFIGLGTSFPEERLHVNGTTISTSLNLTGEAFPSGGTDMDNGFIRCVEDVSSDLVLVSNDNIRFDLDNNGGEDGQFEIFNSNDSDILRLSENGGMTVKGSALQLTNSSVSKRIEFNVTGAAVDINSYDANLFLTATGGRDVIMQQFAGNIGIGTTTPSYKLEVDGTVGKPGGGSWTNSSDRRLKKDIKGFTEGLSLVEKVKPIYFHYNGTNGLPTDQEYVGVIAQELQKVAPFMVSEYKGEDGEDYLAVDPSAFDFILINAVKEMSNEIENLKKELETIKQTQQIMAKR